MLTPNTIIIIIKYVALKAKAKKLTKEMNDKLHDNDDNASDLKSKPLSKTKTSDPNYLINNAPLHITFILPLLVFKYINTHATESMLPILSSTMFILYFFSLPSSFCFAYSKSHILCIIRISYYIVLNTKYYSIYHSLTLLWEELWI